jgi:hypothetical protein
MPRNETTARTIDGLLQLSVMTSSLDVDTLLSDIFEVVDDQTARTLRSLSPVELHLHIARLLRYIQQQGLVYSEQGHVVLTNSGKRRVYKRQLDTLSIPTPTTWDGRWRIILFDIPTGTRVVRSTFIAQLRRLGLQPMQQSVWAYPYECREHIMLIAETHGLSDHVCYIETNFIDQDTSLRSMFTQVLP